MPLQMIVKTRGTHSQTPNLDDYEKSCADFSWTKARNELNGLPDVNAVETATRAAIERLRAGDGPYLLECRTYRFRAHSMYDPELYRSKEEVEQWKIVDTVLQMF